MGLITFDTTPKMKMGISHVLENFRRSVSGMEPSGDTALFDALALAKDQLVEKGKQYPGAKKRCIVISDGLDTKSTTNTAADITWRLREAGVVVDSVSLGGEHSTELRAISYVTVSTNLWGCVYQLLTVSGRLPVSPDHAHECTRHLRAGAIPVLDRAAASA